MMVSEFARLYGQSGLFSDIRPDMGKSAICIDLPVRLSTVLIAYVSEVRAMYS